MAMMAVAEHEARAVFRSDWRIEEDDFDIGIFPEDNGVLSPYPSSLFGTLSLHVPNPNPNLKPSSHSDPYPYLTLTLPTPFPTSRP